MTATITITLFLLLAQAPDPEALVARGLEMAQQKRPAEAEKLWKQALEIAPGLFSAAFNLGFLYYSNQEYAKAEPYLARAVKSEPKEFNARYLLGATLVQMKRTDDALHQWRAALEVRPDHVQLMQMMAVEYGKGRYFREAAAVVGRALRLKDSDPNIYLIAIKAYQDAADHGSALQTAERLARKFPHLPRASFEYAYELHRAGRLEEALPLLKKAMAADQTYEEPFFFYGEILLQEGSAQEAIAPLRKAIELRRDYMPARVTLARALLSLKRYAQARTELLQAIEVDPRHPQPHLLLAQLYFRLGDEKLAAQQKEMSLKLRRENPQALEAPQGRPFQ